LAWQAFTYDRLVSATVTLADDGQRRQCPQWLGPAGARRTERVNRAPQFFARQFGLTTTTLYNMLQSDGHLGGARLQEKI
jgi:hypothetical protein